MKLHPHPYCGGGGGGGGLQRAGRGSRGRGAGAAGGARGRGPGARPAHLEERGSDDRPRDVAHARVGVPDAHDEPPLPLPEPRPHDRHDARPPARLEQPREDLNPDVVPDVVDAPQLTHPEERGEEAGAQHPESEEDPEVHRVPEVPGEEHAHGVRPQEGQVEAAQLGHAGVGVVERGPALLRPGGGAALLAGPLVPSRDRRGAGVHQEGVTGQRPRLAQQRPPAPVPAPALVVGAVEGRLDDRGGLPRRVEEGVCEEREEQDHGLMDALAVVPAPATPRQDAEPHWLHHPRTAGGAVKKGDVSRVAEAGSGSHGGGHGSGRP